MLQYFHCVRNYITYLKEDAVSLPDIFCLSFGHVGKSSRGFPKIKGHFENREEGGREILYTKSEQIYVYRRFYRVFNNEGSKLVAYISV